MGESVVSEIIEAVTRRQTLNFLLIVIKAKVVNKPQDVVLILNI